jgi:hypothetical protein
MWSGGENSLEQESRGSFLTWVEPVLSLRVGFRLAFSVEESKMAGSSISYKRFDPNPYTMIDDVLTLRAQWQRGGYATLPASGPFAEHSLVGGEGAAPNVSLRTMTGTDHMR